ncbi:hypothetical protein GCM10007862_07390 [Dyella lipolytica]|nr:hypothetical protein GCM10007862_07390 [Dyella lipolytica]
MVLGWLAARITAKQLSDQAQWQFARVEADQPLWQWPLRKPRDLIAGRAFGPAKVSPDDDALVITSIDGTPFELGLPIAWSLDLAHWPILQIQLRDSAPGTLAVVWQGPGDAPACSAPIGSALTSNTRTLRIDLRGLAWRAANVGSCPALGIAQMLRLRLQIPRGASLRMTLVSLTTTAPLSPLQDATIDLPARATADDLERIVAPAQNWPMPLFRLPAGISAEKMLVLRDQLRQRWPAALITPAGVTPQPTIVVPPVAWAWAACSIYLLALTWLALRPIRGPLRPWLEIVGCLLGPLWVVIGLRYPTPLGIIALCGSIAFALTIERRHLSRFWRWPAAGRDWLWPLAPLPVALLLIVIYGHALHPLSLAHMIAYVGWAWLQQWLMLVVLMRRFELIMPRPGWAVLATAIVFGLLHTPNGVLMQLCFLAELWWAGCFLRSRSVLPLSLAHAICALLVESGLVGGWLRSLEVSARFFL